MNKSFYMSIFNLYAQWRRQVQNALRLDLVVTQRAVLKLLLRENEALLPARDTHFALYERLDVVDGIRCLHVKRDGLAP